MSNYWPCLLLACLAAGFSACGGESADGAVTSTPVAGTPSQTPPPAVASPTPPADPQPTGVNPQSPTGPSVVDNGPWLLDLARGETLFKEKCQQCHAPNGTGGYGPALTNTVTCPPCAEFTRLWKRIDEYMPFRNPEACDAACSRDIAAWINNGFATVASCSVQFRYDSVAGQRFAATVRIDNFNMRGLAVPAWRLGFTLPPGHRITAASDAMFTQTADQVLLTPVTTAPGIPSGAVVELRLEGTQDDVAVAPRDLRLEAPPCFTAI